MHRGITAIAHNSSLFSKDLLSIRERTSPRSSLAKLKTKIMIHKLKILTFLSFHCSTTVVIKFIASMLKNMNINGNEKNNCIFDIDSNNNNSNTDNQ